MTKPEYVLEFMRDYDMRYFTISNSFDREVVRDFREKSLDDAILKMEKNFKNHVGFQRIKLYSDPSLKRDGSPVEKPTIFEVSITGHEFEPKREEIGNVEPYPHHSRVQHPTPSSMVSLDQYLIKHETVAEMNAKIVRLELELKHTIEKYEKEIEALKKEHDTKLKEAQDSNAMFGQGLSMIMQRMGVSE